MTDEEAIKIAKRFGVRHGPIISIPPRGAVNEIIRVDLSDLDRPIVTREPVSTDWIDIDVIGSMYEEQTNRLGQWRHRLRRTDLGGFRCNGEYRWPPEHPWQDGRAPH